jgi:hypothetical protein
MVYCVVTGGGYGDVSQVPRAKHLNAWDICLLPNNPRHLAAELRGQNSDAVPDVPEWKTLGKALALASATT